MKARQEAGDRSGEENIQTKHSNSERKTCNFDMCKLVEPLVEVKTLYSVNYPTHNPIIGFCSPRRGNSGSDFIHVGTPHSYGAEGWQ